MDTDHDKWRIRRGIPNVGVHKKKRRIALRSHHFIMITAVCVSFEKDPVNVHRQKSIQSLRDPRVRDGFYTAFTQAIPYETTNQSVDLHEEQITMAFGVAS